MGGSSFNAYIDSGADFSLISRKKAEDLRKEKVGRIVLAESKPLKMFTVDNRELEVPGVFIGVQPTFPELEGGLQDLPEIIAFIVPELAFDLIVGRDYIDRAGVVINGKKKCVYFERKGMEEETRLGRTEYKGLVGLAKMHYADDKDVKEKQIVQAAIDALELGSLERTQQEELRSLLKKHWKAFAADPDAPGNTTEVEMEINTGEARPVATKNRPVWGEKAAALEKQIAVWLKSGKIVRSKKSLDIPTSFSTKRRWMESLR